jgi:hypothetical protein
MSDETSTNLDYERLMNTLPAMLAMTINAAIHLVEKSNFRFDGHCTIGRSRFEGFVKAADRLIDRRDAQQTFDENGKISHDKIFVPVIGRPNVGQPVVNDHSDEVEIRADLVGRLYKERKLMDQILGQFRELVALKNDAHTLRASDGGLYAYKVPARLIENVVNYMESPLLSDWRPGEFRSVEVAIALKEALGVATRTMESLFEGNMIPRLMPRAHETMELSDHIPNTVIVDGDEEISVDDVIAGVEADGDAVEEGVVLIEAAERHPEFHPAEEPQGTMQFSLDF